MLFIPTSTFFNLPEEKQSRILQAAIWEFSNFPFSKASIAQIVEKAGIPRGSFYQYFSDLKDLYRYLFNLIGEKKKAYLNAEMAASSSEDLFTLIRKIYQAGIYFANDNPDMARIGNKFFREPPTFRKEILGEVSKDSRVYLEEFIQNGKLKGEVDQGVDEKMAVMMLLEMNLFIIDLMLEEGGAGDLFEDDTFLDLAEKVLYIIENGLKVR